MKPQQMVLTALALSALLGAPLQAKLAWNKKARQHDPAVTGCTSCHVPEKPKKGDPLSERGQWMVEEKKRRGAKDMSLEWLKDYPNNGKTASTQEKP